MLTKYDAIIATATVIASGAKSFRARPASKHDRQEHGHRRQRRREHRQRDGVRALRARPRAVLIPMPLVPVDRLEHDDGVVDEPPHREREPAERERVERLPGA